MNFNNQETPSEIVKQSPGCDPKASKRNSGLFAFFKWLKPFTSRESLDTDVPNSHSSSCDSLNSLQSVGTVASFSYVSPSEYKKHVSEKNITPGPETDTYKARLKQRDKRRENDKNVTLRKKYNLFFNRETLVKPKQDESTKSLPLMTRANMEQATEEEIHIHRRTNSESSKIKKAGAYLHVKGKRKAPQPPADKQVEENISTASLRRRKRIAPPPPPNPDSKEDLKREKKRSDKTNKYDTIEYADADIIFNDSLKLDHGILKPAKETDVSQSTNDQNNTNVENSPNTSARSSNVETPVSPRPWYKRNLSRESKHNTQKDTNVKTAHEYESIERVPEVQYNRNSTIDLTIDEIKIEKKKDEKRKSGLSLLANISELDREASEILNREKQIVDYNIGELPEFMRPKGELPKMNVDNFVSPKRRSSAKDLIAKFNAITNVTKVTVNTALFGGAGKDNGKKDYFGKRSVQENRKQETLLESHKKRIEMIDNKLHDDNKFKLPLMKSESASAIKKPETPKTDRKSWNCPKCYIENDYWRIICHVCSAIKPYFDDLTSNASPKKSYEKLPIITKQETNNTNFERVLERSKTQIGFSALASYNANQNRNKLEKSISADDRTEKILDKKVEREKLKKMLIEMKNSLPKRHLHAAKANSRASVIVENPEPGENISNTTEPPDPVTGLKSEVKNDINEEKVVEIVIGTSETIYENIKVKKTEEIKPIKVSSAAQTSSVIKRTEMPVNIAAVLKKKNTFEPMKAKDFEDIYEDKNGGKSSAAKIYANLVQNDELSLFFNMPKNFGGIKNNFNTNSDTIEINRLLRRLEVAIAKGDLTEASLFAKELAQLKVNCSVIRQKPSGGTETMKNGFSVDMFVEDKISHRGPFPIQVIENQTVAQLKKQVEKEFGIPTNVQRWILGKELATEDNATLKDNNITTEGCPIFLYLVAPENNHSIGKRKSIIENTDKIKEPDKEITNRRKESPEQTIEKVTEACEAACAAKVHSDDKDSKNATTNGRLYEAITLNTPSVYAPKIINVIPKVIESTSKLQACLKGNDIFNTQTQENIKKNDEQEIPKAEQIQQVASTSNVYNSKNFNEIVTITVPVVVNLAEIEIKHEETKENNKTVVGDEAKRAETIKEDLKIGLLEEDFDFYDTKTLRPQANEWECHLCTLLNPLNSNICAVCATIRQKQPKKKLIKRKAPQPTATPITENHEEQTYLQLVNLDNSDLVSTVDVFECLICFVETAPNEGATLRDCLHQFCKICLRNTIEYSIDAEVKCPYRDDQYSCNTALQDREIKSLVTPEVYDQFLARSIAEAENKIGKSFHCKTPDCKGWCIFEDNVNDFRCPVCRKTNCLTCQAIHMGLNCKQFQDRMDAGSETDENAKRTKAMLEEMVNKGEALTCPTCQVIMMKKWGCDWLRCSMCKTEICWVTRGARWGPAGKGDTSGGCRCGVNGVKCHPKCNYCH